jgi:hypothetical protein
MNILNITHETSDEQLDERDEISLLHDTYEKIVREITSMDSLQGELGLGSENLSVRFKTSVAFALIDAVKRELSLELDCR